MIMTKEKDRMKEVWDRMRQEQVALMEARDGLAKLTAKGTTDLWRLKTRMGEQLKDYEKKIAEAAATDNQNRERWEMAARERSKLSSSERSNKQPNNEEPKSPWEQGHAGDVRRQSRGTTTHGTAPRPQL
jgi:hypothetical protein